MIVIWVIPPCQNPVADKLTCKLLASITWRFQEVFFVAEEFPVTGPPEPPRQGEWLACAIGSGKTLFRHEKRTDAARRSARHLSTNRVSR